MIVSTRKGFVFFHLPKAAGSSVERALRVYGDIPSSRLYNYMIDYLGNQPKLNLYSRHISPKELIELKSAEWLKRHHSFAVVRNTWDWHVSQFHFHQQNSHGVFHEVLASKSFSDYVHWAVEPRNVILAKAQQKKFLSDAGGELLVDTILRFESLEIDFGRLTQDLGVERQLGRFNKSKRGDYRTYYTTDTAELINVAFCEDIEYFGFTFD